VHGDATADNDCLKCLQGCIGAYRVQSVGPQAHCGRCLQLRGSCWCIPALVELPPPAFCPHCLPLYQRLVGLGQHRQGQPGVPVYGCVGDRVACQFVMAVVMYITCFYCAHKLVRSSSSRPRIGLRNTDKPFLLCCQSWGQGVAFVYCLDCDSQFSDRDFWLSTRGLIQPHTPGTRSKQDAPFVMGSIHRQF
jgi:hypothetical protein